MLAKLGLRVVALGYLMLILALPVAMVFYRTFEHGVTPVVHALTEPDFLHALWLTLLITAIVVPANTVFGVITALVIVRREFPGKSLLSALIDLPFAVSPVVVGLALFLLYGRNGWFGGWLNAHDIQFIFALPGMILATIFVSLPFVVREVIPVLLEVGTDQEQAASTLGASGWQSFWRVTLPSVRSGVAYGVILTTARALGEFGAVSVVSGKIAGQTATLTIQVEQRFQQFDMTGAYTASLVLAVLALLTVLAMNLIKPKELE
jgi:sulfate transport system permease protein